MPFLRNSWYMAGWSKDFLARAPLAITIIGDPLVFYRGTSGELFALEDRCCHKLAPLSKGQVEGNDIRCMYHGLKFSNDGRCVEVPMQKAIPKSLCVRSYRVIERHSAVWVWMGEANSADESLVPDFIGVDHPDWSMLPDQMDYEVHYSLINDNLLDLTHVPFVHKNSFGGGADDGFNTPDPETNINMARQTVESIPRGFRVSQFTQSAPVAPLFHGETGPIGDQMVCNDFIAPGIILLRGDIYPAGAVARAGGARPTGEQPTLRFFSCQAITPITERSSRYFYSFGPWRQSKIPTQTFFDVNRAAFSEDRNIITAQQQMIDRSPDSKMILLPTDKLGSKFKVMLEKLIQDEQSARSKPKTATVRARAR